VATSAYLMLPGRDSLMSLRPHGRKEGVFITIGGRFGYILKATMMLPQLAKGQDGNGFGC
jgi:hypothetical protein